MAAVTAVDQRADRRRRDRRARQGRRAREARGRLRPGDGEAGEGRRDRRGQRDRPGAADLPLERARRPARDRRRRARRPGAARPTARRPASPTGSPPSCCSPTRSPRASARSRASLLTPPDGPGLGVEIDEEALGRARGSSVRRPVDPTNRNTALASAMVEELARCGVREAVICPGSRSTPLALALWREPAIEARVIVDERSAGFFALGAAQATAHARSPSLTTSGTAAANLHPAVCEADESAVPLIVLTADRPPELRGIGAGQTIDQLKLYGSAVRWFCEVGTHDADDAGLLHFRSVACRAFWTAAGRPAARAGAPERRLARPARARAAPRRGHRRPRRWRSRAASDRPLTTVPPAPSPPARARWSPRSPSGSRARAAGLIVCRPDGAGSRGGDRGARRGDRLPDPRRADLAASLRRPRPLAGDRRLRADRPRPTRRAGARPGPALRRDADLQAAAPVARRPARDVAARRRPRLRLERADPDRRRDRPRRAGARWRTALAESLADPPAEPGWADRWLAAAAAAEAAIADELDGDRTAERAGPAAGARAAPTPTASSSTPPRACRSATRRRSCRAPTPTSSSSPTAARTGSTA